MTHIETDVVVIGTGAMGSSTLWRLSERGVSAVAFEQFEPGHDRGSSHGESRIFRTAYLEGPSYVPLAQRAIELWYKLQEISGVALVEQIGALTLGERDSSVITNTLESIRVHSLPHRLLDIAEIREQYPAHRVADTDVGIFEQQAGFVRPELAIVAAARRAEELGARIIRNARIEQIEPRREGVQVTSGDLTCRARHAIVSAGAWLGTLLPDLHLPVRVSRQVVGWFPIERPEQFKPERFPVFLRDISREGFQDSTFYGFPTMDGATVKVSVHREGPTADPDNLNRNVSPGDLDAIRDYIRRFMNGVVPDAVRKSVCMYTNTPDHDFLIGSPPGMPQVTILGGFSGHGFKFAPIIGEVGADLATRGETDQPVEWLSPNRFAAGPVR